jgi:hypothetical protein
MDVELYVILDMPPAALAGGTAFKKDVARAIANSRANLLAVTPAFELMARF